MKPKILVVGSSNTDMVTVSDRLPKPGETVVADEFYIAQGGKGANQAVAAARLGGEVTFVAKLGDDDFARQAIAGYRKDKIKTDLLSFDPSAPTGTALIHIDDSGENMIVTNMGANNKLSIEDVRESVWDLESADVILSQLEIPVETVIFTAKKAREFGKPFILNPAPINPLPDELIGMCTYIIPNETEAAYFSKVKIKGDNSVKTAANYFLDKGAQNVIITLGSRGAYWQSSGVSAFIEAPKVKAIDTVGAGDVFCGAFSVGIAKMGSVEEAVRFANQCASLAVTRKGAQSGIPYAHELMK
ncbi:MAG: ribokinase [Bacteroidota bacterium]